MTVHIFDSNPERCSRCYVTRFADKDDPRFYRCRPSWHETWMSVAHNIAERSYDPQLKVGAIVVSDDNTRMLSVGYNGNYAGGPNERESTTPGEGGFLHAELNCIIKCDYNHPKKKIMYITHSPCRSCCKVLVNAGISRVVYDIEYRDTTGLQILKQSGVEVIKYHDVMHN